MMKDRQKLVFCTYSSVYSSIVLEQLIADDGIEVVAIINSTRVHHPQYGHLRGAIKQIQLSGWRYSSYLFVVTDLFTGLQPFLKLKTVHAVARQYEIPILNTRDINDDDSIKFITSFKPEYLLAAHFNQLVKPSLLNLPEMECLNIHPSILPTYKGVDPVFYALLNEEKELGVTLHKMAESFDSGEVISQKSISASSETVFTINSRLFSEGAKFALQWINNKESNLMDNAENITGNYDSWPKPEQISQFRRSGKKLITISELWK